LLARSFSRPKEKKFERLSSCKKQYMTLMIKCSNVVSTCVIW
jgi:hypothetical protein